MDFLREKHVQYSFQLMLGGVFIYASIGKILNPQDFANSISNYKLLPNPFINPIAVILPYIEFIFGLALIFDLLPKISAIVLSLLLLLFIIAIFSTIIRGLNIDCGCFNQFIQESESYKINSWILILRDVLFLIPGLGIIFFSKSKMNKIYGLL